MALESVSAAETAIQSSNADDNDLEDGEIPSDEDDEPAQAPVIQPNRVSPEPARESARPADSSPSPKHKSSDKFPKSKSRSPSAGDRLNRQKSAASDDFAGDVEKAIRAALDEDRGKSDKRGKGDKSKARNRKRSHDKEDERSRDAKKKRTSDEENGNEDDDEMLFVRGASPARKGSRETSPVRREECYNSGSDFEDSRNNANRHRDDGKRGGGRWSQERNKKGPLSATTGRRNAKLNERLGGGGGGGNNKGSVKSRLQLRGERNNRRNQMNDHLHQQDPDAICVYYMQGKCHRGDDCPFSHNALPPRKMELCKFYLMDCCAKRDKCLYMHHDFPCKFFHTGSKCVAGENCKFSHQPMSEQVKNILLKHLETAPKEILGNFPRLSREGALHMINMMEKQMTGHDAPRIPSLFDLKVPNSFDGAHNDHSKDDMDDHKHNSHKDRKSQKKTRWGSDEDRVPLDVINKFALLGKDSTTAASPAVNFYSETERKDEREERPKSTTKDLASLNAIPKDVDLRQLLAQKAPKVVNVAEEAESLAKVKMEEGSDREEDASLVIETPTDDDDKSKVKVKTEVQDMPSTLPKQTQELFMRIQQQQKAQEDSFKNLDNNEDQQINQDDWYSDDDDDDDDNQLTIVDPEKEKEEEERKSRAHEEPPGIPQPAPFVDSKLGDLSKIDISMEVSKLLSSIKAQSNQKQEKEMAIKRQDSSELDVKPELPLVGRVLETENSDPRMSPSSNTLATSQPAPVSRDPRMSRDPRQRRDEPRQPVVAAATPVTKTETKETRSLQMTSIYSSGIIAEDALSDVDLRAKLDHDHRRKDMDLRCFPPGQSFGDTDLRFGGAYNVDAAKGGDVDLRMLSMSFKPVPSHVPCTEIEAGITSHPPMPFKVYVVDVPRPDYTGLKISKNDPQVQYDPRLRKILRISDVPESPMSPPPVKMLDTPKSPPLVRADPRRKALEAAVQPKIIPTAVQQHPVQEHPSMGVMAMGMGPDYMRNPANMPVQPMPSMAGGGGGPQPLMGSSMMTGMAGPMMRDGPVMGRDMPVMGRDGPVMSGNGAGPMGPPNMRMGPGMQQHSGPPREMRDYGDPRYNSERGNNVGLLGPGPQQMGGYRDDPRSQYDGPPGRYPVDDYDNYGNTPNMGRGGLRMERGFNGQMNDSNYSGGSDWGNRMGGRKDRRRTTRGKFGGLSKRKD